MGTNGGDETLWKIIFSDSKIPSDLKSRLLYLKNTGTKLIPDFRFGYRLEPIIGKNGWQSLKEYNEEKQCLFKYQDMILHIFKALSKRR